MKRNIIIKIIVYTVLTAVICGGIYIFAKTMLPRLILEFFVWLGNDGM